MGWSIGYDDKWQRDIGYGVPSVCDHPGCEEIIDRGLHYVCGSEPYGGEDGCGLYFCDTHRGWLVVAGRGEGSELCERCGDGRQSFDAKPDTTSWIAHKLTDESWKQWRDENPEWVKQHTAHDTLGYTETNAAPTPDAVEPMEN